MLEPAYTCSQQGVKKMSCVHNSKFSRENYHEGLAEKFRFSDHSVYLYEQVEHLAMPCIEDWLTDPLSVIEGIFYETGGPDHEKVGEFFSSRLEKNEALQRVPSLNDIPSHLLKSKNLVRFRCMVQDMFDPEFYLAVYETVNKVDNSSKLQCGMYQDVVRCPENFELRLESPKNITKERHLYYCVPIPGETEWARKAFARGKETSDSEAQASERRNPVSKRVLEEDMDDGNTPAARRSWQVPDVACSDDAKRSKSSEISGGSNVSSHPLNTDLNFPLPNEHGPACLVHVYDQESTLKVNDMVEFIGVLSVDPCLAVFNDDDMGDGDEQVPLGPTHNDLITPEEQAAHHPPPSLVPRLHVVASRNLVHSNPCIPSSITGQPLIANLQQLADVRGEVVSLLTQVMCGDSLAAEYLLLHLISSVYSWTGIMPVGKFTLNVSGCPSSDSFSKEVLKLVEHLVPKCHFLPMTLNNMNTLNFVPKKDYTANRLKSSILQLSQSTNFIVDETALQAGQLNANGVKNVTALGNVISWQKLEYDFNFYKADFTTNLLILILSEGKSLLPADCHVALRPHPSPEPVERVLSRISSATIQCIRTFLGVARLADYSLSSEMQKILQDDFVKSRQENQSNMTAEDFHLLLLLSRLMSLSHGRSTLTPEMWNQVKQMEKERRARLFC